MKYEYDMVVIGGGAGGLTAAGMSAVLGARTALIEAEKLGGDCTWHGCIPSKSLLKAANIAHEMRTAERYGLTRADTTHEFSRVMARVRSIRERVYRDSDAPPNMEKLGVEVIAGRARFIGSHSIEIEHDGSRRAIRSRWFVIAAGSSPRIPNIPGSESARLLTNESIFELEEQPKRLLILGGGPVGVEMAQAFARLGSSVTVVSTGAGILERDDRELAEELLGCLRQEAIRFLLNTSIERIERGAAWTSRRDRLEFDAILAAVGRQPNTNGLNLEAAGVRTRDNAIAVDRRCRTSARHIYACGDVAGGYAFTHFAEHSAKVAVTNAMLRIPERIDRQVPWCTYTSPELAHAGETEESLRRGKRKYAVWRLPVTKIDRAVTDSEEAGMIKVLADRRGRILGTSILSARAGEMIAEYALAIRNGIRLSKISSAVHPYPTWTLGDRQAADLFVQSKLTPRAVRWIGRLFGLRGSTRGIEALESGSAERARGAS